MEFIIQEKEFSTITINNEIIEDKVYSMYEKSYKTSQYQLVKINSFIENIQEAMGETGQYLDIDFDYLESIEDDFMFAHFNNVQFIIKSENKELFNNTCKDILQYNKEYQQLTA